MKDRLQISTVRKNRKVGIDSTGVQFVPGLKGGGKLPPPFNLRRFLISLHVLYLISTKKEIL